MSLPIDRTTKSALDANLVNGNTSDAPVIKNSNDVVYNTIDELYNFTSGLVAGGALQPYPAFLSRQALINGNMEVWQRGVTFNATGEGQYTADRWFTSVTTTNTVNVTRQAGTGISRYCLRAERSAGNAAWSLNQKLEANDTLKLVGQQMTLSVMLRKSASLTCNFSIEVYKSTTIDNFSSVLLVASTSIVNSSVSSSGFTSYSLKFTVPSDATNLMIRVQAVGQAGASGVYFEMQQAQLNIGNLVLPFQPRSFAEELQLCQRYYEKSFNVSDQPGTVTSQGATLFQTRTAINASTAGTLYLGKIVFKVKKRTIPTVNLFSLNGTISAVRVQNATDRLGSTAASIGEDGFATIACDNTSATAISLDNIIDFQYSADAEI